ncbi:hypothetical protein D0859_02068 [Hortaea werneckii]|uniref:Heterokaryon incompatibility domain-containing protein n=1 Tax=Hortaea werneckii TaxID=91943 RepID=A0A3M7J7T2_HORWE|nr:hypothetical protein D0859_02068 [Hortaea werneckii]
MATFNFALHCPLPSTPVDGSSGTQRVAPAGFRIVKIRRGPWNSEIECNLLPSLISTENSEQRFTPYYALSYHWGPAGGQHTVRILVDSNAYTIQVRKNLHTALRRLRSTQEDVHLWVDALCVDQENKEEKSSQIPLMRLIFSRANSVKVWLGEAAANSDQAMDFIRTCATSDSFNKLIKDHSTPADWAALSSLMRRPWFSRRWIIQEIALGKSPELICGEKSVPWQDFADVISMAAYKQSELQRLFRSSATYQNHPDYLGDLSELGAIRLAQLSDEFFLKGEDGSTQQRLFTLEGLMSSLTAFEASDPHDILYAILWLASDAVPKFKAPASSTTFLVHSHESLTASPTVFHYDLEDGKARSRSGSMLSSSRQNSTVSTPADADSGLERPENGGSEAKNPPSILVHSFEPTHDGPSSPSLRRPALTLTTSPELPDTDEQKAAKRLRAALYRRHVDVDYDKSVLEVCKDFLRFAMSRSSSLDMLCFPWAPNDDSLPSWIPQLKGSAFSPNRNQVHRRINADPLVGRPGHPGASIAPYRACKGLPAKFKFEEGDGCGLEVRGFALFKVHEKKAAALNGTIPAEWLDAAGWRDTTQRPPDVFWRTMIGNRGTDGRLPPVYWWQTCREAFNSRPAGDSLATNEVVFDYPEVEEFVKRAQRMVWRRRLVTLSSEGVNKSTSSIGLAPEGTRKGDLICILYGCSVPVVLREMIGDKPAAKRQKCEHPGCPSHHDPSRPSRPVHYQFIGECYVHGIMDGKALDTRRKERIEERDLLLK